MFTFLSCTLNLSCIFFSATDFAFCGTAGTKGAVCTEGEGDCDTNADCDANLVCGTNNCGAGFDPLADCCTANTLAATVACDGSNSNNWQCCSLKTGGCGENEGEEMKFTTYAVHSR